MDVHHLELPCQFSSASIPSYLIFWYPVGHHKLLLSTNLNAIGLCRSKLATIKWTAALETLKWIAALETLKWTAELAMLKWTAALETLKWTAALATLE